MPNRRPVNYPAADVRRDLFSFRQQNPNILSQFYKLLQNLPIVSFPAGRRRRRYPQLRTNNNHKLRYKVALREIREQHKLGHKKYQSKRNNQPAVFN